MAYNSWESFSRKTCRNRWTEKPIKIAARKNLTWKENSKRRFTVSKWSDRQFPIHSCFTKGITCEYDEYVVEVENQINIMEVESIEQRNIQQNFEQAQNGADLFESKEGNTSRLIKWNLWGV